MDTDLSGIKDLQLFSQNCSKAIYKNLNGPIFKFDNFDVMVEYIGGPYAKDAAITKIKIRVENKYKTQESVNIKWYAPEEWNISPSKSGRAFLGARSIRDFEFELSKEKIQDSMNRFVVELTIDGRHTVMLVPIVLLNGNLNCRI